MRMSVIVRAMTEKGVQCIVSAARDDPFWLPRDGQCTWVETPAVGATVGVDIPDWLAKKHKQLGIDKAHYAAPLGHTGAAGEREEAAMADTKFEPREDSGNLFRIAAEERKNEAWPEYEGEFKVKCPHCGGLAAGWVKAWIKETKAGKKFFSLAFKHRGAKRD